MEELVSIVVPVYNMGTSIKICVESLIKQSYKNIEILLVDDGSTDNSLQVCKKFEEVDKRVRVFHTENHGAGPARNYGIKNAKGRYICFPDADDLYEENAVSAMVQAMSNGINDFVVAGFTSLDGNGKKVTERSYKDREVSGIQMRSNYNKYIGENEEFGINGAPWNKLYDLKIIRENQIEFPELRRHQDTAFIFMYLCHVNNVHFIEENVYIHYVNDLRKEWDKYPINYIESVVGLRKIQEKTVFTWNTDNKIVFDKLNQGYISNTIKAIVYSKKEEIEIIKYVGGSDNFIRMPFIVEGFTIGFIGSTIALFICIYMYEYILENINNAINFMNNNMMIPVSEIAIFLAFVLFITGITIGVLGSIISVKRHLKV